LDAENIRTKFVHKFKILCLLYRLDWQKAFDGINCTKLINILKETDTDRREIKLISKLYMDQSVKVRMAQGETRNVKTVGGSWTKMLFVTDSNQCTERFLHH
jgi:hypothetical protein